MDKELLSDLRSLWDKNLIERAALLNNDLEGAYFHTNTIPMYFTGKRSAQTVMIMLNPGSYDPGFDFSQSDWKRQGNFDKFIAECIRARINYGDDDKSRMDNFDLKQAAFLYSFCDPDLQIPVEFWNSTESKLLAKRNVLMNKCQLELIPYCSKKFSGLLDTVDQAGRNFRAFEPFLRSVLEETFSGPRENVIFCSKQFLNLFISAEAFSNWKSVFDISSPTSYKEGKLTLSCTKVNISYKGAGIRALIANSFPSQALPNAYEKMIRYGSFCSKQLST